MQTPEQYSNEQPAIRLQATADWLTAFRENSAYITGPLMAIKGQSWPLAIYETAAGVTDWLDGYFAKKAKELVGFNLNPDGPDDDREADKRFTYSGMMGTIIRDVVDGHFASAVFVGGVTAISAVRDNEIQKVRATSSKQESSIMLNRVGTVVRIGSLCIGMSPLGKTKTGRTARNIGLGASTAIAGIGFLKTKKQLNQS